MNRESRFAVTSWLLDLGIADAATQLERDVVLIPVAGDASSIVLIHPALRPERVDLYARVGTLARDASPELLRRIMATNTSPALAEGAVGLDPDTDTLYLRTSQPVAGTDSVTFRNVAFNLASLAAGLQAQLAGWTQEEATASGRGADATAGRFDLRV